MNHEIHEKDEKIKMRYYRIFFLKTIFVPFVVKSIYYKESKHWLRMIAKAVPKLKDEAKILWKEANELNLIFSSIVIKSRNKKLI